MNSPVFHHQTPVQIRFNDIDLLGHVNNATIQEYFDLGRMHYLRDAFSELLWTGDNTLIVANINTDFNQPTYLKDEVIVKTTVTKIGNKSLKMEQHLIDVNSNQPKAVCSSVMVAINKNSNITVAISSEWKSILSKVEEKEW